MPTLYELQQGVDSILSTLEDISDYDTETKDELEAMLSEQFELISEKIDAYIYTSRKLDGSADMLEGESSRLNSLAKTKRKIAATLRETVKRSMVRFGVKKTSSNYYNVTVANNSCQSVVILTEDPSKFVQECVKVSYSFDKKAIAELLKRSPDGKLYDKEGNLLAYLDEPGTHLRVK